MFEMGVYTTIVRYRILERYVAGQKWRLAMQNSLPVLQMTLAMPEKVVSSLFRGRAVYTPSAPPLDPPLELTDGAARTSQLRQVSLASYRLSVPRAASAVSPPVQWAALIVRLAILFCRRLMAIVHIIETFLLLFSAKCNYCFTCRRVTYTYHAYLPIEMFHPTFDK